MSRIYLWGLSFLFGAIALLPILNLLSHSLGIRSDLEIGSYAALLEGRTLRLLLNTLGIGASVSVCATGLGLGLGFILSKTYLRKRQLLTVLLLTPLFLPPYIFAVAWVDFFVVLGLSPRIIYSPAGAIFVLTIIYTPISILIFSSSLQNMNASLEEAAMLISPYRTAFLRIILPLIKPAILSSGLLIFILAISEFSVPAFLSVQVMTTEIFTQFSAFYDFNTAIIQSGSLIILCVVLLLAVSKYVEDRPFLAVGSKSHRSVYAAFDTDKGKLLAIVGLYLFCSTLLPIALLAVQALSPGLGPLSRAFGLLQTEMWQSFLYACWGALLLVLVGFGFSYLKGKRTSRFVDFLLILPFALPSVVTGIALIRFYNAPSLNFIYASPLIIIIAYLMRYAFIAEKMLHNRLLQVPGSFEQAALVSGATKWEALWRITVPLVSDALFGAFVISFIFCIGELGTAIMVYPPGTSLLPIKIFTIMANAPQSLTSAMCLVALLFTGCVLGCLFALRYIMKGISVSYGRS
jgi:iron(III) transport system permease protein